jgi:hypothetical protein
MEMTSPSNSSSLQHELRKTGSERDLQKRNNEAYKQHSRMTDVTRHLLKFQDTDYCQVQAESPASLEPRVVLQRSREKWHLDTCSSFDGSTLPRTDRKHEQSQKYDISQAHEQLQKCERSQALGKLQELSVRMRSVLKELWSTLSPAGISEQERGKSRELPVRMRNMWKSLLVAALLFTPGGIQEAEGGIFRSASKRVSNWKSPHSRLKAEGRTINNALRRVSNWKSPRGRLAEERRRIEL